MPPRGPTGELELLLRVRIDGGCQGGAKMVGHFTHWNGWSMITQNSSLAIETEASKRGGATKFVQEARGAHKNKLCTSTA